MTKSSSISRKEAVLLRIGKIVRIESVQRLAKMAGLSKSSPHEHLLPIAKRERFRTLTGRLNHDVAPLGGRSLERAQHLQHVHSQFAAGAVRAVIADGSGHVEQADNSVVGDVRTGTRVAVGLAERVRGEVEWRPVVVALREHRLRAEEGG